ncbi:hypothetical protein [Halegenticoccus tardaugens]|uniref:hypothetical protein n=1 Tax=Halegenticoccus tardaugens TaxID=2071624 RepID=UPI001E5BDF89|nr:hypothetical protein [Halegenticoccus tardaugens]
MAGNSNQRVPLSRRSFGTLLVSTVVGSAAFGKVVAQEDDEPDVETLDGDDVYLIFGADADEEDLDGWIESFKQESSQDAAAEVVQYQDVDQLNVNQQSGAVAVSIDGGDAKAIQRSYQENQNTQEGDAESINDVGQTEDVSFENVGDAYVVFADECSREYSGYVIDDGGDVQASVQEADAEVDQAQDVEQLNYSNQSAAVALADEDSRATSYQRSYQENENLQYGEANATNVGEQEQDGTTEQSSSQSANATVEQAQEVDQLNVNEQGYAIAVAVGEGSVARAVQESYQLNVNAQIASASATNVSDQAGSPVTCVAVAGTGDDSTDEADALAKEMDGISEEAMEVAESEADEQSNTQDAEATVEQYQEVDQENINLQNAAVAVATDCSEATAYQESYQRNVNRQIGEAEATNEGSQSQTSVLLSSDGEDDEWCLDYGNGEQDQELDQDADAEVSQIQYVEQLNLNEQYAAIAYAENEGEAEAYQVNYQENINYQVGEAEATNEGSQSQKAGRSQEACA